MSSQSQDGGDPKQTRLVDPGELQPERPPGSCVGCGAIPPGGLESNNHACTDCLDDWRHADAVDE